MVIFKCLFRKGKVNSTHAYSPMLMPTSCGSQNGILCKLCMFQCEMDQREDRISSNELF
uniref:Uncharacterized protein n=1 Tax=Arundo donax TaxID=35708 RepID=A0A0A8Z9H7_ARUDO